MVHDYPASLSASSRPEVIGQALRHPRRKSVSLEGGKVIVAVDTARRAVSDGLEALHEAEAAVQTDAQIMRGEPCLKGTRIPVYVVASIAESGGIEEARATSSSLTEHQIGLACFYAQAHPRRGRPKKLEIPAKGGIPAKPRRSKTVRIG